MSPAPPSRRGRVGFFGTLVIVVAGGLMLMPGAQAEPRVTVKDVENAFHQVEAVSEQINALDERAKQTKAEIADLTADIDRELAEYRVQRDELGAAIVQQHMDAPLGPTINLIGSGDPETFINGLGAIQALNSTRADALEKFGKTGDELRNRRAQLRDRQKVLESDLKDAEKKKSEIKAKYDEAKAQLAQLTAAEQYAFNASNINLNFEVNAFGRAQKAINFALAQLGDPYAWGGTGPNRWDCSGLMQAAWRAAGVSLPRVVGPQYAALRPVSMNSLQPGDLVFYGNMSHDGMYIGKGRVIHAPRPGRSVSITSLSGFSRAARVG